MTKANIGSIANKKREAPSVGIGIINAQERADLVKMHLPTCYSGYSVVPNFFAGADLFSASSKRFKADKCESQLIQMDGRSYEIYYSGDSLYQSDLNVWLRIATLYSLGKTKIGENVWLGLHDFLSNVYPTSVPSRAYDDLEASILRLYHAEIMLVRPGKPPFICRLISGRSPVFLGNGNKKTIELSIDWTLREAFNCDGFSFINMSERSKLGNNQLALWLHLYYSRHAKPFAISTRFIKDKSGAGAKNLTRWVRCTLAPAVNRINKLNGWELYLDTSKQVSAVKLYCRQKPSVAKVDK